MQREMPIQAEKSSEHRLVDRRSGELLRAMAKLFLQLNPRQSRESLANKLQRHLSSQGVSYHCRTIKRQLAGEVSSVPRAVEDAMRDLLLGTHGLREHKDIDRALAEAGIVVSRGARLPRHVDVKRLVRPTRLWLHYNPSLSKRALALRIAEALARKDIRVSADGLQSALAGKGSHVRSEVLKQLITLLTEHGITSEAEALARHDALSLQVETGLHGRELVSSDRFLQLADVWWTSQRGASKRALARQLRKRLAEHSIRLSLEHLQALVHGKKPLVQQRVMECLEELVREGLQEGTTLDRALDKAAHASRTLQDLQWVQAQPVVSLARKWLEDHPGVSQRKLALRIAATTRRMGYDTSHHTIQPILAGGRKKTRGYIERAMLSQFEEDAAQSAPQPSVSQQSAPQLGVS
jgi:hypothetical protein